MTTGQIMQAIRKERGYTQKQLAEKCGLATGTIQQYELNKREPRREQLQKIADALNVPLYKLMGFDGSIRVNITPEAKEISEIQNKLLNDRENVTEEEIKILKKYYTSNQLKEIAEFLDASDNMVGNITSSGDIVYIDSDELEYNRVMDKQKNGDGFTPYDIHFVSEYIKENTLIREWFVKNGLKSQEKNLSSIQDSYEHLNEEGRIEAAKRIAELTEIDRYTKPKEWFQGRATKEEIEKAVEAYLNDDTSHESYTPPNEPPEE